MLGLFSRRRRNRDERIARELIQEYEALTEKLEQIRTNFDFAGDEAEIDALIYEENAVLCRLSGIYSTARQLGIHADYPWKT